MDKHINESIIKMGILKNAATMGWSVEKQNDETFILRKKVCNLTNDEKNTDLLLDKLFNIYVSALIEI